MEALDKHNGTAEDSNGIFQSFERYLIKLLKVLSDQQRDEESRIMAWKVLRIKQVVKTESDILVNLIIIFDGRHRRNYKIYTTGVDSVWKRTKSFLSN